MDNKTFIKDEIDWSSVAKYQKFKVGISEKLKNQIKKSNVRRYENG